MCLLIVSIGCVVNIYFVKINFLQGKIFTYFLIHCELIPSRLCVCCLTALGGKARTSFDQCSCDVCLRLMQQLVAGPLFHHMPLVEHNQAMAEAAGH